MAQAHGSRQPLRALAGRIGGFARAARYNPEELTGAARRAFLDRFEREVDPQGVLPPEERARRATAARKAYFARLALKSAAARRSRGGGGHA